MLEVLSEFGALGAVADDDDAEVAKALGEEVAFEGSQEMDVLFNREAADGADAERAGAGGSFGGIEQDSIYAAAHEEAGAAGGAFDHFEEFGVGSEHDVGKLIKAAEGEPGAADGGLAQGGRNEGGQAHPGVFVEVGMPTGDERELEFFGQHDADGANVAGPGDVDHVRSELAHAGFDGGAVAVVKRIVE